MGIFKESQIKKLLGQVQAEQMTFSRMVEIMNQEAYKELAYKGQLVTMMDVVRTLEAFLVHNDPVRNNTEIKVKELIDYMKSKVIEGSYTHCKRLNAMCDVEKKRLNFNTMTELQKEFEATGYASWINASLYPDGKIYTQEYTQWLERQVLELRQPPVIGSVCECGSQKDDDCKYCMSCNSFHSV